MKQWKIGLLTPFLDGFYYGDIVWGIAEEARHCDVRITTFVTYMADYSGKRIDYRLRVGWADMDAWIVIADAVPKDHLAELAATGRPIVTIASHYADIPSFSVTSDNRSGMAAAVRHLIALGHSRIGFVGDVTNSDFSDRYDGYCDAYREAGLTVDERLHTSTWSGSEAFDFYMAEGKSCTAIAVSADYIAIELMEKFQACGYRIPEDMAITGFDDIGAALRCSPGLTTIRQPIIQLGTEACRRMFAILQGEQPHTGQHCLPMNLIVRGSTDAGASNTSINTQTLSAHPISDALLENIIESQHMIGREVIHVQDLSWLRHTNQHWGCLALSDGNGQLVIDQVASLRDAPVPTPGQLIEETSFPLADRMPGGTTPTGYEIGIVQPVHDNTNFHGYIATVGPVNERLVRGYDTRKIPNLLGVIHERRLLLHDLQQRDSRNSELIEKLATVSETTSDGFFAVHLDSNAVEWITGIASILGIDTDELPATLDAFLAYVYPEDNARLQSAWQSHLTRQEPISIEIRLRIPDGYRWVYLTGRAVRDADGKPIRMIVSIKDIQARRQAEDALKQSEQRYRHFFHNTPVMILSLDESLHILDANPFWLDKMGYAIDEVRGLWCGKFVLPESFAQWERTWAALRSSSSQVDELEIQWMTRDGHIIDGIVDFAAFADNDSEVIYVTVRDVTEQKAAERRIYQLAYEDPLTGLANRRMFYERLESEVALAERQETSLVVMMLDLDHFKEVNDSLGHDAGDALLRHIADIIRREVRDRGLVARIGGDEFMILLAGSPEEAEVRRLVDDILRELKRPLTIQGNELYVTTSIGLSRYPDGRTSHELVKMADTAMYKAKQQGRNRAEAYHDALGERVLDRLAVSNKLHRAVDRMDSFRLVYQPQIEVASGSMIGVEALLRWEDPELGNMMPSHFIPLAEENGTIIPIGEWVLAEACRQLVRWEAEGIGPLTIAVNISAKQLQHPDFLAMTDRVLRETGADPGRIIFEITESTALQSLETTSNVLRALLDRGILTALDDFGTGYSSLSLLGRLPLRILKIDRSFILELNGDREQATAIVQAIIAMSRSLRLLVLAEGVETVEQLNMLSSLGCDAYQGYYMSRPVTADRLKEVFEAHTKAGSNE